VPRAQVPELFASSDVLVNNMEAGAPDKVVYEAAAACLPVLASNPVFDELFDGYPLHFERDSPESLAERLRWFAGLGESERAEIGRTLRGRVAQTAFGGHVGRRSSGGGAVNQHGTVSAPAEGGRDLRLGGAPALPAAAVEGARLGHPLPHAARARAGRLGLCA